MTRKNKKMPIDFTPDEHLADQVSRHISGKELTCADAFKLSTTLGISEKELGRYADHLAISLKKCQIGLFGQGPGKRKLVEKQAHLDNNLESAVLKAANENAISCESVFEISAALNISKVDVGCACETLGIKIRQCRFGAF